MSNTQNFLPPYEDMVKAGMHFGRKKTVYHPNIKPFIYTIKNDIYILDLIKTADGIIKAVEYLKKEIGEGKTILFVGMTKHSSDSVKKIATDLKMPYVVERWLGGTLTNFKTITSRVKYMEDLEKKQAEGDFEKYTKKEKILKEKEIVTLKKKFDGIRNMTKLPDVVFVTSLKEGELPVHEAKIAGIKVVGIVNSDSDPKKIDYPIVANDNSRKSVELILEAVKNGMGSN